MSSSRGLCRQPDRQTLSTDSDRLETCTHVVCRHDEQHCLPRNDGSLFVACEAHFLIRAPM